MSESISQSLETPDDLGSGNRAIARRWKLELKLAEKRERNWRKTVDDIYKAYTPDSPEANSFNILWSNTETLRQAVYNSLPEPQCKRRYADNDPLGLKVSEVMTRALSYLIDCGDFDNICKQTVLGMLLAGRAVIWEQYVPKINTITANTVDGLEEQYEQITWEQVESEKVSYKDFRILGDAKCWDDVPAIARRYYLTRDDLIEKFGEEIGNAIKMESVALDEKDDCSDVEGLFKTAEVWAIWDKETKRVIFINESIPVPCKIEQDQLNLEGFFPTPRPLYAIENDDTMVPACLYTQYEQQAKELNRISARINKLVDALRVRGVYDATLTELSQLMKQSDNNFIPAQNVRALIERGGLDKAIWMMPIDTAAMVLKELYAQREATKQVIYEISGISDIMRSASDPNETFGAQKIKTQWGTQRLQKLQREVQRYIRDVLRIKAEIICKKFQPETIEAMTMVQLPHSAEVMQQQQMAMAQYQNAAMAARQNGVPLPPPPSLPPNLVTWEQVIQSMQNDMDRSYRIDIETDSTLAAGQMDDAEGLRAVIGGIVEIVQGFAPAVQAGAIPVDTVKALIGVVIRRAKLGSAVEDAMDNIVAPKPQADPEVAKAQAAQQQKMAEMQMNAQIEQLKAKQQVEIEQAKMQVNLVKEQAQAQGDAAKEQYRMQADMQIEQTRMQMDAAAEEAKLRAEFMVAEAERNHKVQMLQMEQERDNILNARQLEFDKWKVEFEASTKILIAQMASESALNKSAIAAQQAADSEVEKSLSDDKDEKLEKLTEMHGKTIEAITGVMKQLAKPKKVTRDADGKVQGIE